MTKGEYRVGLGFNPSGSGLVAQIKVAAAEMIDLIDGIEEPLLPVDQWHPKLNAALDHAVEVERLKALAATAVEEAAMWAVKAATKPAPKMEG